MQKMMLFAGFMFAVVLITAATSHSDSATQPTLPTSAPAEPITGTAFTPTASGQAPRDPFTPYSIGPATGDTSPKPWLTYEDMTPAQKAVIDKGRDVTNSQPSLDAFAQAATERAHQAAGEAAQHQLGLDEVAATGVVP